MCLYLCVCVFVPTCVCVCVRVNVVGKVEVLRLNANMRA
jgi:hypothetical protein